MLPREQWPSTQPAARKIQRRRSYERNAEKRREESRQYRAKYPEVIKARRRAYYEAHREEVIKKVKDWQNNNQERKREWNRKRRLAKYGLTVEQFDQMLQDQKDRCALCFKPFTSSRTTHVDHCHKSGKARAILCGACNRSLGVLEKLEGVWLERAMVYLAHHKEDTNA